MSPAAEFDWSKRRILVIEDDAAALELLRAAFAPLRLHGLDALRDGGEVLAAMKRNPPDLVLMEASPRGTDGLDTLRAIRGKDSPNPDVIVAVMAAVADAERLRRMCGIGIESFIRKPLAADVLVQCVQGALVSPRRFISSLTYFGPDRRKPRAPGDPYRGQERRRIVKPKERDSGRSAQVMMRDGVLKRADGGEEAAPPPAAPKAPIVRKPDRGDSNWSFEAPPMPDKPVLHDDIPLVDDPVPKKVISAGAVEVPNKPAKKKDDGAWAEAMAPKKKVEEEDPGFDVAGMVSSHNDWLSTGGSGGSKAMVENEDLSGAMLRNVRLSSANLRGAVLQSADLRGSDLSGVDLTDGDLTSSNMRRVDLSSARLTNTKLAGTDLAGASLRGASMEGTDLKGANLLDADIASTDLSAVLGIVQTQINKSRPNAHTVLPAGIRRPAFE